LLLTFLFFSQFPLGYCTTEIRYFTTDIDSETNYYILNTTQTSTSTYKLISRTGIYSYYAGIRVFIRDSEGTETEITNGVVAVVMHDGVNNGLYSATWNCPETPLNPTDRIIVRVYHRLGDDVSWSLASTFITPILGASKLNAATWTVYYYLTYISQNLPYPPYFTCSGRFFFGSTYNSRIEGFSWSSGVVKQWNTVSFWQFSLETKEWVKIADLSFNLMVKAWNTITEWFFSLPTQIERAWHKISYWILTLTTEKPFPFIIWVGVGFLFVVIYLLFGREIF